VAVTIRAGCASSTPAFAQRPEQEKEREGERERELCSLPRLRSESLMNSNKKTGREKAFRVHQCSFSWLRKLIESLYFSVI